MRLVVISVMTLCTLVYDYQYLQECTVSIFKVEGCRKQISLKH